MALILVADDDPALLDLVRQVLESRGHQVVAVDDGLQLVEKAKDFKPQLIVCDIMMPNTYGTAAMSMLHDQPALAQTPVIFITGVPLQNARKILPDSPRVRLLAKPVDMMVLLQNVDELLKSA